MTSETQPEDKPRDRLAVYRLLETLGEAGFVARSGSADRFCLARKVRTLSDGFVDDEFDRIIAHIRLEQWCRCAISIADAGPDIAIVRIEPRDCLHAVAT